MVPLKDIESFLKICAKEKRIILGIEGFIVTEDNIKIPQLNMIADFSHKTSFGQKNSLSSAESIKNAQAFFNEVKADHRLNFEFIFQE